MIRRLHAPTLFVGEILLDPVQARHAREVLRLEDGTAVEVFDDAGSTAVGTLLFRGSKDALVRVERINASDPSPGLRLTIASAVPKGERADWMVEKLSELGVFAFIPLATERSIVKPEGKNKYERWVRITTESAKQSRRAGVMRIEELRPLQVAVEEPAATFYLSTAPDAVPLATSIPAPSVAADLTLLIGPEGGWTPEELRWFESSGIRGVKLTSTVLRVETAAIAAAAIAMAYAARQGTQMDANQRE